jgi:uncharacterized membrane protein
MAAVNADTWATELGVLSPTAPRLITSGKKVERGTSGGGNLPVGSLAALGGATLVGLVGAAFSARWIGPSIPDAGSYPGWSGGSAFLDSFLGASVQAIYFCPILPEGDRTPS